MKRLLAPLVLAALWMGLALPARAGGIVSLVGPDKVDGLRVGDVDGDGAQDILVLEGRTLWFWKGRKDGLPKPKASRTMPLPDDVNAVAISRPNALPAGAGLLVLGSGKLRQVDLATGRLKTLDVGEGLPTWVDTHKAAFVDFVQPGGEVLLPLENGWRLVQSKDGALTIADVDAPPFRELEPAGAFLEDTFRMVVGHRHPFFGRAPDGAEAEADGVLWMLSGGQLLAVAGAEHRACDISRVPPRGVRRLADLDGNGVPDLCHREGAYRYGIYNFYRIAPLAYEQGKLEADTTTLGRPATTLRLEGSQIEPRQVDLDGDGKLDFVVTTIPIDAGNTTRALTSGMVRAHTQAYLQREGDSFYALSPDASVSSDVRVAIRFTKAGTIDVRRSFTILPDADLDGDGRKDLVIRTDVNAITIRRGARSGVWEEEGHVVEIPDVGKSPNVEGYCGDLDGDGADEIILLYRAPHGGRDVIRVVKP